MFVIIVALILVATTLVVVLPLPIFDEIDENVHSRATALEKRDF